MHWGTGLGFRQDQLSHTSSLWRILLRSQDLEQGSTWVSFSDFSELGLALMAPQSHQYWVSAIVWNHECQLLNSSLGLQALMRERPVCQDGSLIRGDTMQMMANPLLRRKMALHTVHLLGVCIHLVFSLTKLTTVA